MKVVNLHGDEWARQKDREGWAQQGRVARIGAELWDGEDQKGP